ncbi:LOW QUALITY PROTEIN: hypothetical protein V2J09_012856, partial [Rumex salicifolius]
NNQSISLGAARGGNRKRKRKKGRKNKRRYLISVIRVLGHINVYWVCCKELVKLSSGAGRKRGSLSYICLGERFGHEFTGGDMLKPRDTDIPFLFLVLVVLPVVAYILLGRWSDSSKKKERIDLLAQLVAEESVRAEVMAGVSVIPPVSPPKAAAFHECARLLQLRLAALDANPSGKCQIMHWRHVHKDECQPLDSISQSSKFEFVGGPAYEQTDQSLSNENVNSQFIDLPPKQPLQESSHSDGNNSMGMDASKMLKAGRRSADKRSSRKSSKEFDGRENRPMSTSNDDNIGGKMRLKQSKEAVIRNKYGGNDSVNSIDELSMMYKLCTNMVAQAASREQPCIGLESDRASDYGAQDASEVFSGKESVVYSGKVAEWNSLPEHITDGGICRPKTAAHSDANKIPKSSKLVARSSVEHSGSGKEKKGHIYDEPIARMDNVSVAQAGNKMTFMKTMGLKKSSKISKRDGSEVHMDSHKKVKMLFPYEEFIKFFQYDNIDITPRGLSNCGNSCYANAVLQCLTCTKPLLVYLLSRTHSRSCCVKRWCLMCELEQHVATLKDSVGPLSPSRILSQMRSMNCPMGDGSQEDAHEFLRLLVASMQSICLEEVGGEKQVHPILQETTYVQHTFGGRLRSKVECLKCHHRSERCENIMDLTLEIFGWVESLEDALTQFTSWEDLDGENMYKCGRCISYVRAKKQLRIDEAPNILTIVLKRFQEGSYGKINKCITFPEMLDMIPYMTGTYDVPPLYMLYAVVVHMDTLNASFSGHYVSYVKDLQGNWLRIDDSEVQRVPMSHVMSEGAYILFYMRSYPRPHASAKNIVSKSSYKSPRSKSMPDPLWSVKSSAIYNSHTSNDMLRNANRRLTPVLTATYPDFSDAASSSDWSLFTSSDDASFTTESTRDSFSTANDHPEAFITDPVSSFFDTMYPTGHSSQRTVSCRMFSGSQPQTGFVHEEKGFVESYEQTYVSLYYPSNEEWGHHVSVNNYNHHDFAAYDGNLNESFSQTHGSWCRNQVLTTQLFTKNHLCPIPLNRSIGHFNLWTWVTPC